MAKIKIKFLQGVDQFQKGDVLECSPYHANFLRRTNPKEIETTDEDPNIDGPGLTERQAKQRKAKADALRKKAKELEKDK